MRVLGVFAHPDDEVFCAGGTLAKYAAAGAETRVISATRGEAGQIRDASIATRKTLGDVREQELHRAGHALGVTSSFCWDYGDGRLATCDQVALTSEIVRSIRAFRPDVVVTFGEEGAYGHPDHKVISTLTTQAFELSAQPAYDAGSADAPFAPSSLYHSHFPHRRFLMSEHLAHWLVRMHHRFRGTVDFINALALLSEEAMMLHYASDYVNLNWFPPGAYISEQGEKATDLYLIISGHVQLMRESKAGRQRTIATLEPGEFFGETALGLGRDRRSTNAIAIGTVTCMVFSQAEPELFLGRGEDAALTGAPSFNQAFNPRAEGITTCIDVSEFVLTKVKAIAEHRSQFALDPSRFPHEFLAEMISSEYFIRRHPPDLLEDGLSPSLS